MRPTLSIVGCTSRSDLYVLPVHSFAGGMSPPPLATVRGWIHMLSHHYPERMGKARLTPRATSRFFFERLTGLPMFISSQAIAIKVPWILNQFFKIILPLIDPVTRAKLSFNEPAVRPSRLTLCAVPQSRVADVLRLVVSQPWVPDDQLQTDFGGKYNFEFDQEGYLPSLFELCSRRRAEYRKRWEEDGSRVSAPSLPSRLVLQILS